MVAASQKWSKECNNMPLSFCQASTFPLTFEPDSIYLSLRWMSSYKIYLSF